MSISSRITSMEEHIGDVYDTLELGGAELTNTDKNLVNISPILRQKYIDYMNNGTREIWDNWEKVTGTGSRVTLNNTIQAPMDLGVKGNTTQNQYEGKNLFKSYTNTGSVNARGVTFTMIDNNTIELNGTSTGNTWVEILEDFKTTVSASTTIQIPLNVNKSYTIKSHIISGSFTGTAAKLYNQITSAGNEINNNLGNSNTFNNSDGLYRTWLRVFSGTVFTNLRISIQLEEGSTATSYEPYVGGTASPNPSFPSPIHNVTGDVEVLVQNKNLINNVATTRRVNGISFTINNDGSIIANGTATGVATINLIENNSFILPAGTYTLSGCPSGGNDSTYRVDINNGTDSDKKDYGSGKTFTLSEVLTVTNVRIRIASGSTVNNLLFKPMLEKGSTVTTYTQHKEQTLPLTLGNIELCKIGDYQDYIYKTTGKNLLLPNSVTTSNGITTTFNSTTQELSYSGTTTKTFAFLTNKINISLKAGDYTFTRSKALSYTTIIRMYFDSTNYQDLTILANSTYRTISLANDIVGYEIYVAALTTGTTLNETITVQLEKGSSATDFEPYGSNKWYLHKEIGKDYEFTVNGNVSQQGFFLVYPDMPNNIEQLPIKSTTQTNYSSYDTNWKNYNGGYIGYLYTNTRNVYINKSFNNISEAKAWLLELGTVIYYPLATPTNTEITDATLISQLEAISNATSYDEQTNISGTSDGAEPILDIVALKNS